MRRKTHDGKDATTGEKSREDDRGFTLVELLIIIGVIAIFFAVIYIA